MLCQNRFVLPGSPSTCTIDTALVPLPSFLLIVFGAIVLVKWPHDRTRFHIPKWIHILYMALVVAAIAMTVLELARDGADHLGVGLIPMVLIGLIIVFVGLVLELKGLRRNISTLFAAYWLLNIIFQSVKVARLKTLAHLLQDNKNNSKYPTSDQLLDNAVILGLYVVFLIIEAIGFFYARRQRSISETTQPETKAAV